MSPAQVIAKVLLLMPEDVRRRVHIRCRESRVVFARDTCVLALRQLTSLSYPEIAKVLGYRSHNSVIAAHKRALANPDAVLKVNAISPRTSERQLRDVLMSMPPAVRREVCEKLLLGSE